MNNIMVSVCCITYNQEDYISDAIESFLMQKTNFKYEILIHDDASSDNTSNIIKEYERKYPDIIKPIYQTENQYSKGIKISQTFNYPRAKGKYIALCEGDDYWTDENKLQKQYDYMENHKECNMCIHGSVEVKADNKLVISTLKLSDSIKEYDIIDSIDGIGRKVATNSFFFKSEFGRLTPEFLMKAPCGDYTLPIICAENGGKIVYLPYIMSAHRAMAKNSMNESFVANIKKMEDYYKKLNKSLNLLDVYTNYNYTKHIEQEKIRNWAIFYLRTRNKNKLKEEPYKSYLKTFPMNIRVRRIIDLNFPFLIQFMRKTKYKVLNIKAKRINKNVRK